MTTSTLDQIDWATCLDDTPACERPLISVRECGNAATSRVYWICACSPTISCAACVSRLVAHIDEWLRLGFTAFTCSEGCGLTVHGNRVSDLLKVVPL